MEHTDSFFPKLFRNDLVERFSKMTRMKVLKKSYQLRENQLQIGIFEVELVVDDLVSIV